jgi:hypothetical protein
MRLVVRQKSWEAICRVEGSELYNLNRLSLFFVCRTYLSTRHRAGVLECEGHFHPRVLEPAMQHQYHGPL